MPFQIRASNAVEDMMFAVMEPRFWFEPICRAVWASLSLELPKKNMKWDH